MTLLLRAPNIHDDISSIHLEDEAEWRSRNVDMATQTYIPIEKPLVFWHQGFLDHGQEPSFDFSQIQLEIGPGNGAFILHQCLENPKVHFVAIELKQKRFLKIIRKATGLNIQNLTLIKGDARECLARLFCHQQFEKIFVLFPDPWPKRAHGKHRMIKTPFVNQLKRLLTKSGAIYCATDAQFYAEEVKDVFQKDGDFKIEDSISLFPTYFETKWKQMGRVIHYFKFSIGERI